jgi:hypothetical protein
MGRPTGGGGVLPGVPCAINSPHTKKAQKKIRKTIFRVIFFINLLYGANYDEHNKYIVFVVTINN